MSRFVCSKFIKTTLFVSLFTALSTTVFSQTMNSSGNWDDGTKWTSGNIGDAITENVTLSGNTSPTVRNGFSYTIGNLTAGGDNTITVDDTGSLTLGAAGTPKSLTMTGNNPKLTIRGTLTIWGNVTFTNKVVWEVRGTVIIKGNLTMNGGANLDVKNGGLLRVEGNFTAGNNTDVSITGSGGRVVVVQNVNVGTGNLNPSSGSFQYGGTCSSANPNFCNNATYNSALPVQLVNFDATSNGNGVMLNWATAIEKNFDRFIIEHSIDGINYEAIGEQKGHGNSMVTRKYLFVDNAPVIGRNYYRLKSVDLDLTYEYSPAVFVFLTGQLDAHLYPNPVSGGTIHLTTNFPAEPGDRIEVVDYLGTLLMEIPVATGSNEITVESGLQPGMYVLRYNGKKYSTQIRFTSR